MNQIHRLASALVRSPILWGLLVSFGFFAGLHSGVLLRLPLGGDWQAFFLRYTAGHEIEYVETGMFFVALAALILKALDVAAQQKLLAAPLLGAAPAAPQTADDCPALLAGLEVVPEATRQSYLWQRIRSAVEHVHDSGSADNLDEHLKYLADCDAAKSHGSYAFVRIVIWAIPIMGFLGTVVGITIAIANLSPEALEESLPQVTAGLGVAFDTTALALALATILMFAQYAVDRREGALLDGVERAAHGELAGRFERLSSGGDPQVAAVRRMADAVLKTVEHTVERQAALWQNSLDAAQLRWSETTTTAERQLVSSLTSAVADGLSAHASAVAQAGSDALSNSRALWMQVQGSLERFSEVLLLQQGELGKQGEVLLRVVAETGQVRRLEEALNHNLAALSGSQNFEETVQSLAAVIHLLNARLGHLPTVTHAGRGDVRPLGQAA